MPPSKYGNIFNCMHGCMFMSNSNPKQDMKI